MFGDASGFFLMHPFLTWVPRGPWIVFRESVNLVVWVGITTSFSLTSS